LEQEPALARLLLTDSASEMAEVASEASDIGSAVASSGKISLHIVAVADTAVASASVVDQLASFGASGTETVVGWPASSVASDMGSHSHLASGSR